MGSGTGGAVLMHVGTNNAEKEGTSADVGNSKEHGMDKLCYRGYY